MKNMIKEKIDILSKIFDDHCFNNFYLDKLSLKIHLVREDNSKDGEIFQELNILTTTLISENLDFSVDEVGTIIID